MRLLGIIGGAHEKILHIDLSSGETHVEHPVDDFFRLLVGGRAVVAYLLVVDSGDAIRAAG